ncbi:hypothetical protein B0H14DRAFT_2560386 [Mycena olivaceomarginata]|nr:hypothetical protein B0H14DRAFT_2560386 [Mycena olivaceomarginata]
MAHEAKRGNPIWVPLLGLRFTSGRHVNHCASSHRRPPNTLEARPSSALAQCVREIDYAGATAPKRSSLSTIPSHHRRIPAPPLPRALPQTKVANTHLSAAAPNVSNLATSEATTWTGALSTMDLARLPLLQALTPAVNSLPQTTGSAAPNTSSVSAATTSTSAPSCLLTQPPIPAGDDLPRTPVFGASGTAAPTAALPHPASLPLLSPIPVLYDGAGRHEFVSITARPEFAGHSFEVLIAFTVPPTFVASVRIGLPLFDHPFHRHMLVDIGYVH